MPGCLYAVGERQKLNYRKVRHPIARPFPGDADQPPATSGAAMPIPSCVQRYTPDTPPDTVSRPMSHAGHRVVVQRVFNQYPWEKLESRARTASKGKALIRPRAAGAEKSRPGDHRAARFRNCRHGAGSVALLGRGRRAG